MHRNEKNNGYFALHSIETLTPILMRKIFSFFTGVLLLAGLALDSSAQTGALKGKIRKGNNTETRIAGKSLNQTLNRTTPGNAVQALWDVNLSFDPTDQTGLFGWAGVTYAKGHFFCSKWNGADTIAIFDSTGNFEDILTIPTIGAVRGMTFDGQYIYAANNTRFIQVIDPNTFTKVKVCTVAAAVGNTRWITYNPEGNAGAGSFYCGNYGTALFQVRRPAGTANNMASINNIAATVHGLTGMYGVAYEANGVDSKFWAYDQAQAAGAAVIVQLNANGTVSGVNRNTDMDSPSGAAGSAGGICFGNIPGFPSKSLICLNQGGGVVAYDTKLPGFDASFDSLATNNGLISWPKKWAAPTKMSGKVRSNGVSTLANFSPSVDVMNAETGALVQNLQVLPLTIPAGQVATFETAELVPGFYDVDNLYMAQGVTNYAGDETADNDSSLYFFSITDSTLSQDYIFFDASLASPIGIGAAANDQKSLGSRFNLPVADTLTSVSYYLVAPFEGESSSISIYTVSNGVPSENPIATTTQTYTATAADEADGVVVTLKMDTPLALPAGDFLVAVNELGDSTAGLGSLNFNFKPNTFFVKWNTAPAAGWLDLLQFGGSLQLAFAIYPNFGQVSQNTTTLATCSTSTVSAITFTGASVSSTVIVDGGSAVTARGVCWSTSPNPTVALSTKTIDGAGNGDFTSNVTGLAAGTLYYIRAYATNGVGTSYGNESFFTTQSNNTVAALSTTTATILSATSVNSGGTISSDGGAAITARGVCWSTSSNPTIALSTKTFDGTGTGTFTSSLTGLTPNVTYFLRAYAQNNVGVAYGNEITFVPTTPVSIATLSTAAVSILSGTSATSGGNVTNNGGGPITVRGVCWSTSPAPTNLLATKTQDGTGSGVFTSNISGLSPSTTYFLRAYAENSAGVAYGNEITFSTDINGVAKASNGARSIDFVVSPNPAHDNMNLKLNSTKGGNAEIRVMDIAGKEVMVQTAEIFPGSAILPINLQSLVKGSYMVEIRLGNDAITRKFIKD